MTSQYFDLHPVTPQLRSVRQAAEIVRGGGVIAYPTDSCYALGCHINDKNALERLRVIRGWEGISPGDRVENLIAGSVGVQE